MSSHLAPRPRSATPPSSPEATLPAGRQHPRARAAVAGVLVLAALGLWLWLGDYFALAAVGYLPLVLFLLLTGQDEGLDLSALWSWSNFRSVLVVLGGLTLLVLAERVYPVRKVIGRLSDRQLRRTTVALVAVAVAVPTGYAVTRLAWALGIPLGVSAQFLAEIQPIVLNGLALAVLALGGAVLTVGLVRPWGEVWPRWLPVLGARPVPVRFPVTFALGVSVLVMVAGLFFVRAVLTGTGLVGAPSGADHQLAAWLPEMFWPLWSLALAGATFGYRERRRRAQPADHAGGARGADRP
jgi:hypothetical protein